MTDAREASATKGAPAKVRQLGEEEVRGRKSASVHGSGIPADTGLSQRFEGHELGPFPTRGSNQPVRQLPPPRNNNSTAAARFCGQPADNAGGHRTVLAAEHSPRTEARPADNAGRVLPNKVHSPHFYYDEIPREIRHVPQPGNRPS